MVCVCVCVCVWVCVCGCVCVCVCACARARTHVRVVEHDRERDGVSVCAHGRWGDMMGTRWWCDTHRFRSAHGKLSRPCMRSPRRSERSPRRSLNCTTASDAGSGRYASTVCCLARERARRLRSPRSCCGARPGATTRDRAAGRVRSGGVRSARPNTVRTDAGSACSV
jgi:hypothetical protein